MTEITAQQAWQRRPDETDKAYSAFLEFLKMPVKDPANPKNNRTLQNIADRLGYKSMTTIEGWSRKFNWLARARAYDDSQSEVELVLITGSFEQAQLAYIEQESQRFAVLALALDKQIMDTLEKQKTNQPVGAQELTRLIRAAGELSDLQRRAVRLPTSFRGEILKDEDDITPDATYIIG